MAVTRTIWSTAAVPTGILDDLEEMLLDWCEQGCSGAPGTWVDRLARRLTRRRSGHLCGRGMFGQAHDPTLAAADDAGSSPRPVPEVRRLVRTDSDEPQARGAS
jgi:hypothetical protein